jgi:hypothetical protein
MRKNCTEGRCRESAIASLEGQAFCRAHFLAYCYKRLETIANSVSAKTYNITQDEADAAARFLQDCMRAAADIASAQETPTNLERAQVYDALLWASELHGRLRRSPRKAMRFPILLRSDIAGRTWKLETETSIVSRHGMNLTCRADLRPKDSLTCIRLDTGRRAEAIVAWTRTNDSGDTEAGIEFPREENFWDLIWTSSSEQISAR